MEDLLNQLIDGAPGEGEVLWGQQSPLPWGHDDTVYKQSPQVQSNDCMLRSLHT